MDKRLNIPEPSSIRGSRIPLVRHAMGQIIARQSKRRLIALGMLLTALVAGGLLIAQAIDRDAPAGTTVAVGFSPQGVLVDSRTRHVFTLDGVGVDRQGRYIQTGAVSMLDAGTGAVLRSMPVGQSPTWITDDERTRRAFVIVLGGGGANGLLVRTLDTTSGAVLGTAVLLTSSSTGGSVRLGRGVSAGTGGPAAVDARCSQRSATADRPSPRSTCGDRHRSTDSPCLRDLCHQPRNVDVECR